MAIEPLQDNNVDGLIANTMEGIQQISSSIHKSKKVRIDYSNQHSVYKLPVLDTELWLETRNGNLQIRYSHYAKRRASKTTNTAIVDRQRQFQYSYSKFRETDEVDVSHM